MTTIYEIEPNRLIEEVAKDLKQNVKLKQPDWSLYVKTGPDRERQPENPDWWWVRAASLLRKIYINGPVGIQKMRTIYGGKKNRGRKPEKFNKSGGKIIRTILKDFDALGFTEKVSKGRAITPKGQSYLDEIASRIAKNV